MINKNIFLVLMMFMMILSFFSYGEDQLKLSVQGKGVFLENEIVSNNVRDINGRIASGLVVMSSLNGLKYNSNNGIIKVNSQYGKDFLYLSPDERVIEVFKEGYLPLKIILSNYGINMESGKVWQFKIFAESTKKEIPVNIIVNPEDADIFIDGKKENNAIKTIKLQEGKHKIRIEKIGFSSINKEINVSEKNTLFEFRLTKLDDAGLEIETEPSGAEVFINDKKIGVTPLATFYPVGKYNIKISKEYYFDYETMINIILPITKEKYKLEKKYGDLKIVTTPQENLSIYLNGNYRGKSPLFLENIVPGEYEIFGQSDEFETDKKKIIVEANKTNNVVLEAKNSSALLSIETLGNAKVYVNGSLAVDEKNIKIGEGLITIEITHPQAKKLEKKFYAEKGGKYNFKLFPDILKGNLQIAVTPFDSKIEIIGENGDVFTSTGLKNFTNIPIGNYKLRVYKDRYLSYNENILLKVNETILRNVKLEKALSGSDELFVFVNGGEFEMGDNFGNGDSDEKPLHKVQVSSFLISRYEVSQKEWKDIMGYNPSSKIGNNFPVENVSWFDAVYFCNQKSKKENLKECYKISQNMKDNKISVKCDFKADGYRLPTEAEWEFAAKSRGMENVKYGNGSLDILEKEGNFNISGEIIVLSFDKGITEVGQYKPNLLGLYDISGNVWEWCWDWYGHYSKDLEKNPKGSEKGIYRVVRGGSWKTPKKELRVSNRDNFNPYYKFDDVGLRLVKNAK